MDRPDSDPGTTVCFAPDEPAVLRDDVVVSVCTTCRVAGSTEPATEGPALLDALKQTFGDNQQARVRAVQCLSVCKRPVTVAVTSGDGYTFLFGDLDVERGVPALADFVKSYRVSSHGLVPWRARAEVLRKGMVARVPPPGWSPENGEPPK
jgi:predicted metal-binding protein